MISRDDEKQHPEQRGLDARGAVGLGRAVMVLVVAVRRRGGGRFHQASAAGGAGLDVLDRLVGRALDALDELVGDPLRGALGQRRDDDLGDVEVLDGVHHRRVGVGVADHARRRRSRLAQRRRAAAAGAGAPRAPRGPARAPAGTTTMKRRGPSVGERLQALDQLGRGRRQVGDHQRHVEGQALGGEVDHDVLDRQAGLLLQALDQVAPQPARGRRGQGRDDDLVDAVLARPRPWRR